MSNALELAGRPASVTPLHVVPSDATVDVASTEPLAETAVKAAVEEAGYELAP